MAYEKTTHYGPCPHCHGTGKIQTHLTGMFTNCSYCGSSGRVITGVTERTTWPDIPTSPSYTTNHS